MPGDKPFERTVTLSEIDERPRLDIRTVFNPRELANIEYGRIREFAYAADPGQEYVDREGKRKRRGKPTAKHLMGLLAQERDHLGQLHRRRDDYEANEAYIRTSSKQREIKALYLELGMAEMLAQGDWSVNRENEISEGFGVAPLNQVESLILNFHLQHGTLATTHPIEEGKLVHLHAGCGNGVMAERLRRDRTDPFGNGRRLLNYWTECGYADRIYFTLEDLLLTMVKDEHREDPALQEFIKVISTLLLRRIYFAREFPPAISDDDPRPKKKGYYETSRLLDMTRDANVLREVLLNLPDYIENLDRLEKIKGDGEFLRDTDIVISAECRELLAQLLLKKPTAAQEKNLEVIFGKPISKAEERFIGPSLFLDTYFKRELWDTPPVGSPEKAVNLSEHITIWPHHVVLGKFEEFGELIPQKPMFDLVSSYRATSHLQDVPYENLTAQFCRRLKPGGVILDDGKRESYTRYERISHWQKLQEELGQEYRIEIIADAKGPKTVLVQRGIPLEDGSIAFFDDEEKSRLLLPGCFCIPIDEYAETWPEKMVMNQVRASLRELFIDSTLEPTDTPEEKLRKVLRGRFSFQRFHGDIERLLHGHLFNGDDWRKRLRTAHPDSPERRAANLNAFGIISTLQEHVAMRLRAVTDGAVLLQTGDFCVETFPVGGNEGPGIDKKRQNLATNLSRNSRIPNIHELENERAELVSILRNIKRLSGHSPITLVEFDACFTNDLMRDTLHLLLGEDMAELVKREHVKLQRPDRPSFQENRIYVLGGSLNDASDPYGNAFTDNFSVPLVEAIEIGRAIRALGVCFGHQTLVEAYGRTHGLPFKTERGALEFGAFPVVFSGAHASMRHVSGKSATVAMTRSGYTLVPGYEKVPDMKALAFEGAGLIKPDKWAPDYDVPPVAFSLAKGRIVTSQFHPDIQLSNVRHRKVLQRYLARHFEELRQGFAHPSSLAPTPGLDRTRRSDLYLPAPPREDLSRGLRRPASRIVEGIFDEHKQKQHHPLVPVSPRGLNSRYYIYDHNVDLIAQDKTGRTVPWVARDIGPAFLIPTLKHHAEGILQQLQTA